jgi:hypothetical protein
MNKIGRNHPCLCGSGKKFKKCCGALPSRLPADELNTYADAIFQQSQRQFEALRLQREKQQGLGKGIISANLNGKRIVVVGNKICSSERWKTFHDFLVQYLIDCVGHNWFRAEKAKSLGERHPIVLWHDQAVADFERIKKSPTGIATGPMTGALRAFLNLGYNLYLIGHHAPTHEADLLVRKFVNRIKSARYDAFIGALFETYAAAAFLKAGFTLEYENERDGASSHVEFTATYPSTGKRFSVEVKARNLSIAQDGPIDELRRLRIANKLNKALSKKADHTRVVMIEVNIPDVDQSGSISGWRRAALDQIRFAETSDTPGGEEKPSAYVVVTNHAFHNNLHDTGSGLEVLAAGCRIPDFGPGIGHRSFKGVLEWKERHREMLAFLDSLKTHYDIPATFDGEIPEMAFASPSDPPRLRLGQLYEISGDGGRTLVGRLRDATVLEQERKAFGTYETVDGQYVLVETPLTEAEITAWKRHPETFFGELRHVGGKVDNWLELADFMYETYKDTPRDTLLKWMEDASDLDRLRQLSQADLAIVYCERCAFTNFDSSAPTDQL